MLGLPRETNSYFIIGVSGSGKTTFAKTFCETSSRKAVCLNSSYEDFPPEEYRHVEPEQIPGVKNSIIIYDDIVLPTARDQRLLRDLLTRHKRHSNCTILLMSHSLASNNCSSLYVQSDKIVFTRNQSNFESFKKFASVHAQLAPQETELIWSRFVKSPPFSYLIYNMKKRDFMITDVNESPVESDEDLQTVIREKIGQFLKKNDAAKDLFDFIFGFGVIDTSIIEKDLSVTVTSQDGTKTTCNLLDFLQNATNSTYLKPSKKEETLFHAISQRMCIPKMLLKNRYYINFIDKH